MSDELVKNLSNKIHIALIENTLNTLLKNDELKLRAGIDKVKNTIVSQHSIESTELSIKERRSTLQPGGVFDTIAIKVMMIPNGQYILLFISSFSHLFILSDHSLINLLANSSCIYSLINSLNLHYAFINMHLIMHAYIHSFLFHRNL